MNETSAAEAYYPNLYRFALSLAKHESDAADLVQQTYWVWMKCRKKIRNPAGIRAWLFTTLYREFLRERRRGTRVEYRDGQLLDGEAGAPAPAADGARRLDGEWALNALRRVPEPHRAALALFYLEEYTYAEIATILDIAPGTVMSRIYRGKQILKSLGRAAETPSSTAGAAAAPPACEAER